LSQYWAAEFARIGEIHEAIHQLAGNALIERMNNYSDVGVRPEDVPRLSPQASEPLIDLTGLRKELTVSGQALQDRGTVALSVAEIVIGQVAKTAMEVPCSSTPDGLGSYWPVVLLALCNGYPDVPVAEPWTDRRAAETDQLLEELGADGGRDLKVTEAGQMWQAVLSIPEDGNIGLAERVKSLKPPLVWKEVLYHFLWSLKDQRGEPNIDKQRREISRYIAKPLQSYCLDCDHPFNLDSRHLGRFICPRCRAKIRQRRNRQPKGPIGGQPC